MGDTMPHSGNSGAAIDGETTAATDLGADARAHYIPYRPPTSEYTPPASPQPSNPYAPPSGNKGFGAGRSRHPANLQMNTTVAPAYERPMYSPSPSSSPPLPPSLPSPKYPLRQRAPSVLRHAAASAPRSGPFPRTDQPMPSPTFAPSMLRQASGPGATTDPRTFFNPLASNPVNQHEPSWGNPPEEVAAAQPRSRGFTNPPHPAFAPHPLLRAATSIPDYGQVRTNERPNLSGAYRPNRGVANWSHNDYSPRPRASFRSGWTNASSGFFDPSGTERSSMATGRSSISDNRTSTYSRDRSEDREIPNDAAQSTEAMEEEEEDDMMSAVEDVIDAYCYDEDVGISAHESFTEDPEDRSSSSPLARESEYSDLSSSHLQGTDSRTSYHSSEALGKLDNRSESFLHDSRAPSDSMFHLSDADYETTNKPNSLHSDGQHGAGHSDYQHQYTDDLSPFQLSQYSPTAPSEPKRSPISTQRRSMLWRRSSADLHRPESVSSRMRAHEFPAGGAFPTETQQGPVSPQAVRQKHEIYNELKTLPSLPANKSRLSRQDWADIQIYSKKHTKGLSASSRPSLESDGGGPNKATTPSSPPKTTAPLPEVDEEDVIPRRASTSVFDRRSNLIEFGKMLPPPPTKSKTVDFGNDGRRVYQSAINSQNAFAPVPRDRYGFKKGNHNISVKEYDAWCGKYNEHVSRRRNKWIALMTKNSLSTSNPTKFPDPSDKVKRYVRKGYPPEWRGAMWWFYSGGQYKITEPDMVGLYASLKARVDAGELNRDDREAIERDLDRTFPDNINFRPDSNPNDPDDTPVEEPSLIKNLREVLSCFAMNNPSIGYCQSLNFIAGLLLLFLKEDNERAFILLTIITQNHLPGAHARNLANTEVNVLMMLIKDYLPKVWASINDTDLINSGPGAQAHPDSKFQRQPTVALSCTGWFMSVFISVLPIETVLRVWDAFLYEGPRALFRYALAIFKLGEAEIKKYRPGDGELYMAVQNLPRRCLDPNVLHDIAFVKKGFGSLTQAVIDQKRLFWRDEIERAKKPKEGALLTVKSRTGTSATEDDAGKQRGGMGGLRRKASKRFLRKRG